MLIRHIVGSENVDAQGFVIDPRRIRHGIIRSGRISGLSGEIDPYTHLNLDFLEHRAELCVIADRLEIGSPVKWEADGLRFARVDPDAYERLGHVDLDARRLAWLAAHQSRRKGQGDTVADCGTNRGEYNRRPGTGST